MEELQVPFLDLKRGYQIYGKEIEEEVIKVLRSSRYLNGKYTEEIEKRLSSFLGVKKAIGVSSGTEALYLILKALDFPKGSYVLLPSFTFISTAEVVVRNGLVPWFVDIEEEDFFISLDKIKEAWEKLNLQGKKVVAIITVSLFGIPGKVEKIEEFCKEKGLILIEDICQSFGAKRKGKFVGTFGKASATSFYPSKPLSTCGDAGMVFTNDNELSQKIRILKEHGQTRPYFYEFNGINGRMDEIHAAILTVKFKYFQQEKELRLKIYKLYKDSLKDLDALIKFPEFDEKDEPVFSLLTLRVKKRDRLKEFLAKKRIQTGIYYSLPLHLQPVYKELGFREGDLHVTEKVAKEVLSLPFFPYLKEEEVLYVCEKIKEFYGVK